MAVQKRRLMTGAFVATAWVLVLASTAFACTTFLGNMSVTAGGGTSSATGSTGGMSYCSGVTDGASASSSGTISVSVSPATGSCAGQLPNGTYRVTFINNNAYAMPFSSWILQSNGDCMAKGGSTGTTTLETSFTVTSGSGSDTSVTLPSGLTADSNNPGGTRSGVCVSDFPADPVMMSGSGMEVPLKIVTI